MTNIKKIIIYGERCSGTNFLEQAILTNFDVEISWELGSKHFFCFNDHNKRNFDDTLFIGIIRNPIYWLNSFSKELHHIPDINKISLRNFLLNEFYSVDDEIKQIHKLQTLFFNNKQNSSYNSIIVKDLNYTTGKKYKNVFELRKLKNYYLMDIMPTKVRNYILINYENLLLNYEDTLELIKNKYNLTQRHDVFKKIIGYKKSDRYKFFKQREITFSSEVVDVLWKYLDATQELKLGYFKNDDNKTFIKNKINDELNNDELDNDLDNFDEI
jgi:hypothetical protein